MRHYHFFYISTYVKSKTCSPSYFTSLVTVVYSPSICLSVCLCLCLCLCLSLSLSLLFLLQIKSRSCPDENTPYSCDKEVGTVINLKYDMTNILNWFRQNSMKANPDKFQFMILGPSDDKCFILKINAIEIRNTSEVELLGLTIDHKLKFDAHIVKLCKTARFKLHVLRRIRKF